MWCGRLVYRLRNLHLLKYILKIETLFERSFIHTMHNLYPSFDNDASNRPKQHYFEITHSKQCYTFSKYWYILKKTQFNGALRQTAETWRG